MKLGNLFIPSSNNTIFSKKIVLLCLILVVITEISFHFIFKDRFAKDIITAGLVKEVENSDNNYKILSAGDSIWMQVDREVVRFKPQIYSMLPISSGYTTRIIGEYFLIKRYIDSHKKMPEIIVIGQNPYTLLVDLDENQQATNDIIIPVFTNFNEILEIFYYTHNVKWLKTGLLTKLSNIYKYRRYFKEFLTLNTNKEKPKITLNDGSKPSESSGNNKPKFDPELYYKFLTTCLNKPSLAYRTKVSMIGEHTYKNDKFNRWEITDPQKYEEAYQDSLKKHSRQNLVDKNIVIEIMRYMHIEGFFVNKMANAYMNKLLTLTEKKNIKVIYTPVPVERTCYALYLVSGDYLKVNSYFYELESKYNNFEFKNDVLQHLPSSNFIADHVHVNPTGWKELYFRFDQYIDFSKKQNETNNDVGLTIIWQD